MKKILIIGTNSFVGTNFRKYSQYKNIEEVSLFENNPEDINFNGYDVVLHLAAIVHQSKKISEEEYNKVNRDLCLRVAESAKKSGIGHFLFLSSLKVYGDKVISSDLRNEGSECFPNDFYGKSKYQAELGLKALADNNFKVSIIRPPLIYGEEVRANMLSLVKLVESFPFLPFKKIHNKRNLVFAENLVGYIDRIIEKDASGTFIVVDEIPLSTTELVDMIAKYLGRKVFMFKLPEIAIRVGTFLRPEVFDRLYGSMEFDNSKTKELLNFKPAVTTDEGIRKMILSYKKRNQIN